MKYRRGRVYLCAHHARFYYIYRFLFNLIQRACQIYACTYIGLLDDPLRDIGSSVQQPCNAGCDTFEIALMPIFA